MRRVLGGVIVLSMLAGCVTTQPSRQQAASTDLRDQWDVRISKAELVFPGVSPAEAAEGIKNALSQFAIPADLSYRPTPPTTPARPGAPQMKRLSSEIPSPEYVCEGAYAEIAKRPPPVQNAFAFISEGHQVCLYSFSKGVKAYVIYYNIKKLESLTAGLFNGITRAIRGSDEERAKGQLTENIEDIRAELPSLLVERIEIPGMPEETPDLAAVQSLIPAAAAVSLDSDAQRGQGVTAAAQSSRQDTVQARKSLNEMGLMYHSQSQFEAAIKRNDELAVDLFLSAGAVSVDTVGKDGKTPLQLSSNANITALLQSQQTNVAASPALAPELPSLEQAYAAGSTVDFTKVPADFLAEIDDEVAKLNLSDEQKLMMRTKLAQQYLQMKRLADAVNR